MLALVSVLAASSYMAPLAPRSAVRLAEPTMQLNKKVCTDPLSQAHTLSAFALSHTAASSVPRVPPASGGQGSPQLICWMSTRSPQIVSFDQDGLFEGREIGVSVCAKHLCNTRARAHLSHYGAHHQPRSCRRHAHGSPPLHPRTI
jgi:hypothetical protein